MSVQCTAGRHPAKLSDSSLLNRQTVGASLAILGLVGLMSPAKAEPSFDCNKAATTAENLICNDSALSALDQSLADAFQGLRQQRSGAAREQLASEQRAWLAGRDRGCGIAGGNVTPTLEQRWTWAPCLAEQYRARLTQLGITVPPVARPEGTAAAGFIHPLCLDLATGSRASEGTDRPIPVLLDACNRGLRHIDVTRNDDGSFGANGASGGFGSWFAYRPIGRLASGETVVNVQWSGGGTGQFSEIDAVRTSSSGGDTMISARTLASGGDRCNGGIERASMPDSGSIETILRSTPADIISAGDSALDVSRYDLAACAICCGGTLTYRLDVASGRQTLTAATVSEALADAQDDPAGGQACFDHLVRSGGALPRTFTPPQLSQLTQQFVKSCKTTPQ